MWRPWRRRPRQQVTIDPVQVEVVSHLLRFGPQTREALFHAVEASRGTDRDTFGTAMLGLLDQRVAEHRFAPERDETTFVLTKLGLRLRGKLPSQSRSRISFYL